MDTRSNGGTKEHVGYCRGWYQSVETELCFPVPVEAFHTGRKRLVGKSPISVSVVRLT